MGQDTKLLTFPCQYPIKIIGNAGKDFNEAALAILHQHIHNLNVESIAIRPSAQGKYEALTVVFTATSQQQLDDMYRALTANSNILMVL